MLGLAAANAAAAGIENVEFLKGFLEDIPLGNESVDVVISNCVINLAGDKPRVLGEAARVLRSGGRLAVSDVIADADMDESTRADVAAEGDRVVGHFRCSGTHRGEWLGLPATGRRFEQVDEIYVFDIRDGKLVSAVGVEDNLTRMRQLGIVPVAGSTELVSPHRTAHHTPDRGEL